METILATALVMSSDIVLTVQFYREYFAMKRMCRESSD